LPWVENALANRGFRTCAAQRPTEAQISKLTGCPFLRRPSGKREFSPIQPGRMVRWHRRYGDSARSAIFPTTKLLVPSEQVRAKTS